MVNKPKAKGTKRETWLVNRLIEAGLNAARSSNNLPGRDVDVHADVPRIVEVKDRQQLNVHKALLKTQREHPEFPPAVLWHRTSKAEGQKVASPDGPTIVALPFDDWIDLLKIAKAARDVAETDQRDPVFAHLLGKLRTTSQEVAARWGDMIGTKWSRQHTEENSE